jgi:hypothetical protein
MRRIRMSYASLLLLFVLAGCATFTFGRTLVVTGESLKGVGNQFITVATTYKQGCDVTKSIPPAQCKSFRAFGEHFQKSFPLTVQLWEAARSANDKAMQDKIEEVIVDLATALSQFAVQVIPQGK